MKPSFLRFVAAGLLAAGLALTLPAQESPTITPKPDPWKPVRFLLGQWEGTAQGEPGTGTAVRSYAFVLNNRYLEVRNQSTYPPQAKNPKGEVHHDWGMISYDRAAKKLVLRQFNLEGYVNHYVLDSVSADGRTVIFVTTAIENIPPGWRGRETYTWVSDDEFAEKFELAEPGKDFAAYSESRFRRKQP
jgi:hypothetical protein